LKAKQAGQVFAVRKRRTGKVVNIMDALKRSLEAEGADGAAARRPRAPSKKPVAADKPAAAEATRKPKARKAR
jgi:non-homologous end joining protein Ku